MLTATALTSTKVFTTAVFGLSHAQAPECRSLDRSAAIKFGGKSAKG